MKKKQRIIERLEKGDEKLKVVSYDLKSMITINDHIVIDKDELGIVWVIDYPKIGQAIVNVCNEKLIFERINLGCGNNQSDELWNIDISLGVEPDIVSDARHLNFIENNTVKGIYCSHLIEHFGFNEVDTVLKHWISKLEKDGIFFIACPDLWLQIIQCNNLIQGLEATPKERFLIEKNSLMDKFNHKIFGDQDYITNFHKSGHTISTMTKRLESLGMKVTEAWTSNTDMNVKAIKL